LNIVRVDLFATMVKTLGIIGGIGPESVNRPVESRFQRWSVSRSKSWGDAPGWYEGALLALIKRAAALDPSPRWRVDR
jgi:hypothetical protein